MLKQTAILVAALLATSLTLSACNNTCHNDPEADTAALTLSAAQASAPIPHAATLGGIATPAGYNRLSADSTSFAAYLRQLPLKPEGSPVKSYDGKQMVTTSVAFAVVDMEIGTTDLLQCADAVIRLRAEWLYAHKRYSDIAFHFTSGFLCEYVRWAEGGRISVSGNRVTWTAGAKKDYGYPTFRRYLDKVFTYAGTLSLSHEMKKVKYSDMQIGDVFLVGGSPGHAIIVVDMAEDSISGDRVYMVAESYMPAQDIHILLNGDAEARSPWYSLRQLIENNGVDFPTWKYGPNRLHRF